MQGPIWDGRLNYLDCSSFATAARIAANIAKLRSRLELIDARLRGDRVEAARLNLSPGSVAALGQGQKSECASGKAREAEEDWRR
jgi:hypothetical protein